MQKNNLRNFSHVLFSNSRAIIAEFLRKLFFNITNYNVYCQTQCFNPSLTHDL